MSRTEFIDEYQYDETLCRDDKVWIVIKGFKQLAIVHKVIERKGNKAFGLTSASIPSERKYSQGMIVQTDLGSDVFDDETLQTCDLRISCVEPFDIDISNNLIAYTSGYELVLRKPDGAEQAITSGWMAFLHSVEISPNERRVLTASAGFDTLLELDIASGEVVWQWNAWDHGFNHSARANLYIVRNRNQLPKTVDPSSQVIIISDPRDWPKEGVPTYQSPARLNGAHYDNDRVLFTCFHRPEVFTLTQDGSLHAVNLNLSHPHSFMRSNLLDYDGYLVTNTGVGEFLLLDEQLRVRQRWVFRRMPADAAKRRYFGEWIQSVVPLTSRASTVAAIDTLRDGIHLVDLRARKRRFLANPPSWTVQKLVGAA